MGDNSWTVVILASWLELSFLLPSALYNLTKFHENQVLGVVQGLPFG